MSHDRRSVLAALGLAVPFGLPARVFGSPDPAPVLQLRPFEEAVRDAFGPETIDPLPYRRIEVGYCDAIRAGVQGCINDRPFAGFPAGYFRIVRTGSHPGPIVGGVRLYVTTVDIEVAGRVGCAPGRSFNFAAFPPAPQLAAGPPGMGTAGSPTAKVQN